MYVTCYDNYKNTPCRAVFWKICMRIFAFPTPRVKKNKPPSPGAFLFVSPPPNEKSFLFVSLSRFFDAPTSPSLSLSFSHASTSRCLCLIFFRSLVVNPLCLCITTYLRGCEYMYVILSLSHKQTFSLIPLSLMLLIYKSLTLARSLTLSTFP